VSGLMSRNLHRWRQVIKAENMGLVTILPAILIVVVLLLIPGVYTVILSILPFKTFGRGYVYAVIDKQFYRSLWLSVVYGGVTVTLQLITGLFAAIVIHRRGGSNAVLMTVLFGPYVLPSAVAVLMWQLLLGDRGLIARLAARFLGISPTVWLDQWVFGALIVVSVWQFYPFVLVTLLAQLRRIPQELFESAAIDGANEWQAFRHITLPSIGWTLFAIAVVRTAFMFTKFDTPWLLAGRSANDALTTLPVYIFQRGASTLSAGGSAGLAAAIMLGVSTALLLGIATRVLNRYVEPEED
jgi:multiple sugar transport system permease protein